jgi:lysyl-tRNA synthetase class 1
MLQSNLRRPINRVPDPHGREVSYARSNEVQFEQSLAKIGVQVEFIYQSEKYARGDYAAQVRQALERRHVIKAILDKHRSEPLGDDWVPTSIFCESCERDEMEYQRYDGEWAYSYKCDSCGHEASTDIRTTKNLKLGWRVDWPMRWAYEKVDFEPGGKDHSSEGGSFDTGKEIVKQLWDRNPPIYLQYDFVSIKGLGGKMSSSKGVLITLDEAYEVYSPQMVRWIFASQRSNHDFAIAFDEDVIRTYDEFDRAELGALGPKPENPSKWEMTRRVYELSCLNAVPAQAPYRAPFRELCNRLQVCDGDIERTRARFYQQDIRDSQDAVAFEERAVCAWRWLEKHAPEEFKYRINSEAVVMQLDSSLQQAVVALRKLVAATDLDAIETDDLNQKIYDEVIRGIGVDGKIFFPVVYQKLISRDRGPRLPGFLKEIGKDRLLGLL